jgi:hypothetical protein
VRTGPPRAPRAYWHYHPHALHRERRRPRIGLPAPRDAGNSAPPTTGPLLGLAARQHQPPRGARPAAMAPRQSRRTEVLNTADTPLFHKDAQLFGAVENLADGGVPVIAEERMDAIAVTSTGSGRYIGVAALGTSLTDEPASQLACQGRTRSLPRTATSSAGSTKPFAIGVRAAAALRALQVDRCCARRSGPRSRNPWCAQAQRSES